MIVKIELVDRRFGLWRIDVSKLSKEEKWRSSNFRTLKELNPYEYYKYQHIGCEAKKEMLELWKPRH